MRHLMAHTLTLIGLIETDIVGILELSEMKGSIAGAGLKAKANVISHLPRSFGVGAQVSTSRWGHVQMNEGVLSGDPVMMSRDVTWTGTGVEVPARYT